MAKVSICIPAYGNPVGICRLLESVRIQKYRDFEVIVTDDSPDDSVEKAVRACLLYTSFVRADILCDTARQIRAGLQRIGVYLSEFQGLSRSSR